MASTTSSSAALRQWASIIKCWPVDKVRPENVAFQTVMQKRIDRVVNPSPATHQPTTLASKKIAGASPSPHPVWNEDKEARQVRALNLLLENKYANAFPLASTLRHPFSNPTYYDDLVKELDEAPTRGYITRVLNRLRGVLRFK